MKMFSLKDRAMTIQNRYLLSYTLLSKIIIVFKRVWKYGIGKYDGGKYSIMAKENVTDETRKMGFEMCRDSIGGAWAEIEESQLQVQRLSGGLTNYLYICSLPDSSEVPDNHPRKVLLRVYGDIATKCDFLVKNSVIFALMSEKKLGPKLYGMNPKARIEEYIETRCLRTEELQNPTLSRMIATKLANFHALDMPLCKEPRFLNDTMDKWIIDVLKSLDNNRQQKDAHFVQTFKNYNLANELTVLKGLLASVASPVVFSHNDLQEGNILYMPDSSDTEKILTVIDWEYCSYSYRGADFGNHFLEWCFDYQSETESPYYKYMPENYPTRDQQYEFFRAYLQTSGDEISDEVLQEMYVEANTFALASHFFWSLWSVLQNDMSDIQFDFMEYADCRLKAYFLMKERFPSFD